MSGYLNRVQLAAEQERASPVAAAEPSPAALLKRGRRRTDEDFPLCSFSDLMAHRATQTMNVVAVPGAANAAFTALTKPTARQAAAVQLLETQATSVQ